MPNHFVEFRYARRINIHPIACKSEIASHLKH